MTNVDEEKLRQLLEWLGAQLLTTDPQYNIELSHAAVAQIVAILSSLPEGKRKRPKQWTHEIEIRAIFDMLNGKAVDVLAGEIAAETGQNVRSAERRLWALKDSRRFKIWQPRA
jgi:hypothetical protein